MKILLSANVFYDVFTRKKIICVLKNLGYMVVAVAISDKTENKISETLNIPVYPVQIKTRGKNPLEDLKLLRTYKNLYKKLKPDLILHFGSKPDIYGGIASKILGIPHIANVTGLGKAFVKKSVLTIIMEMLYRISFNNRQVFVFFQNKDDKALFLKKKIVKEDSIGLLPGSGVDTEYFKSAKTNNKKNKNFVNFAFFGRLMITKGIKEYIDAAEQVKDKFPECMFHVAGSYSENDPDFISKEEIQSAEKKAIIKYHGYIKDSKTFLDDYADCVVFPSYYREGVPRVLLEGAAMGKPLIGADSVGTREPIKDGANGYLVKKQDSGDLVEKMIKFLNLSDQEKNKMGEESRKIAEEEFSDQIIVERYLSKIKELLIKKT